MWHRFQSIIEDRLLFYGILTIGLCFVFLVPPFQKPDEDTHFRRTVALSTGQLFCTVPPSEPPYYRVPQHYYDMPNDYNFAAVAFNHQTKFPLSALRSPLTGNKDTSVKFTSWCAMSFIGYIPNTMGFLIGSIFTQPLIIFYLGRLAGLLFFCLCLIYSLKKIPTAYRPLVLFYAAIPMVLHQVSAFAYDVVFLSLVPIVISLLLHCLISEKIKKIDLYLFFSALVFFILVKQGYYAFILLYFVIPYKKIAPNRQSYARLTVLLYSIAAVAIAYLIRSTAFLTSYAPLAQPILQIQYVLDNPSNILPLFVKTWSDSGESYIRQLIGVFGWLDYSVNFYIYVLYIAGFSWLCMYLAKDKHLRLSLQQMIILCFVIVCSTILVFFALYLGFTPIGKDTIIGVQGRYLLPMIPLLAIVISQCIQVIERKHLEKIVIGSLICLVALNIIRSIYLRYYDYSEVYDNSLQLTSHGDKSTSVSVDHEIRFMYQVPADADNAVGLALYIARPDQPLLIPYYYRILDATCTQTKRAGVIDIERISAIKTETIEKFFFPTLKITDRRLCISLKPFWQDSDNNYLKLQQLDNQILFSLLYRRT